MAKPEDGKTVAAGAGGTHPLKASWAFWFLKKAALSGGSYEKMIKKIATFDTVESFWACYSHMIRPGDNATSLTYHLFRDGVVPVWEDATNRNGGKWTIRLKKGVASRVWEDVLLAVVGDRFGVGDELCGVVLAIKFGDDVLSVWTKTATNKAAIRRIRDVLRKVLGLSVGQTGALEYTVHDEAIKASAR